MQIGRCITNIMESYLYPLRGTPDAALRLPQATFAPTGALHRTSETVLYIEDVMDGTGTKQQ